MAHDTAGTDRSVGFGVLFAVVALVGALTMVAAPGQLPKAWGFALAVAAALLAVVSIQVYD